MTSETEQLFQPLHVLSTILVLLVEHLRSDINDGLKLLIQMGFLSEDVLDDEGQVPDQVLLALLLVTLLVVVSLCFAD